jgi:hypothetical protein
MSQFRIDTQRATKKWSTVLENMGVKSDRIEWMSEMAEYHSINENAYANASNVTGMGSVVAAQPNILAGNTTGNYANAIGSGDVGQNLLPVAMKIAAQTIGLDLVAVKPAPGPKIDLLYVDFRYDDNVNSNEERPQVFKANLGTITLPAGVTETQGGLVGGRVYVTITGSASVTNVTTTTPTGSKQGILEYLGKSRIDSVGMFRAFRQINTASSGAYNFDQTLNTFNATQSMIAQLGVDSVELVSALEDHIPGFSANWTGKNIAGDYPMDRNSDDNTYPGILAPKISSKTIAVGTIEVSSALRRTEIEDIKANTGMDIVQKMESILVNELSQTISKQIVAKIFEMGELNRSTAPERSSGVTIFDLNTTYVSTGPGGETTHAVQRKLITKISHASNYIATEGRIGPAQYLVTNGGIAAALSDISGYTVNPVKSKLNGSGQLYPVGQIGDISIYVDPYMKYNDNRIALGRKNNPDQPGIIFVPYLMAQSISVISEATFAPRMLLRSRYAIAEVGWFPQKQYMTIHVTDAAGYLN